MLGFRIEVIERLPLPESVTLSELLPRKKCRTRNQIKSVSTTTSKNLIAVVRFRLRWNVNGPPSYLLEF